MKRWAAVVIITTVLAASTSCGNGAGRAGRDATIPPNLTLDEVYARMERALDGGAGNVFHASISENASFTSSVMTPPSGGASASSTYDLWIDARNGVARLESRTPSEHGDAVERLIVRKDGTYRVSADGRSGGSGDSLTCRGTSSALITRLMLCSNALEQSRTSIEPGTFEGQPTVVLHTTGILRGEDERQPFENRLYVDIASYLPLGAVTSTEEGPGIPFATRGSRRYRVEFVSRASLAGDFFEPTAIAYATPNPAANMRSDVEGMRVYWIGSEFAGPPGAPPLSLLGGGVTHAVPAYFESFRVSYELKGTNKRGHTPTTAITLRQYPADTWQTPNPYGHGVFPDQQGKSEDVPIPGGRAALFRVHGSNDRYTAQAYFDTTVVLVTDERASPLWGSHDAMIEILKALRPYP